MCVRPEPEKKLDTVLEDKHNYQTLAFSLVTDISL